MTHTHTVPVVVSRSVARGGSGAGAFSCADPPPPLLPAARARGPLAGAPSSSSEPPASPITAMIASTPATTTPAIGAHRRPAAPARPAAPLRARARSASPRRRLGTGAVPRRLDAPVLVDEGVGVEAELLRVGVEEAPHVGGAGERVPALLLHRDQVTGADLGPLGDLLEVEAEIASRVPESLADSFFHAPIVQLARVDGAGFAPAELGASATTRANAPLARESASSGSTTR